MGVPKGTDNFKGDRDAKQQSVKESLSAELEKARKRKMLYPDMKTLVADMSERVKRDRTTLKRNPGYLKLLSDFLATQAGASTIVSDNDAPPALLRAKLLDARMETGSLRKQIVENDRLRVEKASNAKADILNLSETDAHLAFVDTVWAMREILERINIDGEVFEVDMKRCEIRDLAAAPGHHIVVAGKRLRPFIEALRKLKEQEQ